MKTIKLNSVSRFRIVVVVRLVWCVWVGVQFAVHYVVVNLTQTPWLVKNS